jgi:hypothetical protein
LLRQARLAREINWAVLDRDAATYRTDLIAYYDLINVCAHAANFAIRGGDIVSFIEFLRDEMGIQRILSAGPASPFQNQALSAEDYLSGTIAADGRKLVAALNRPSDKQAIAALIRDVLDDEPVLTTQRRLAQRNRIEAIQEMRHLPRDDSDDSAWERKSRPVMRYILKAQFLHRNLDVLRNYDVFEAALGKPSFPLAIRGMAKVREVVAIDRWNVSYVAIPDVPYEMYMHFGGVAFRRMAAISVAIRVYQSDHGGRPPKNLGELIPDYLPSIPIDPFDENGSPIRLNSQRSWLYSVGTPLYRDLSRWPSTGLEFAI